MGAPWLELTAQSGPVHFVEHDDGRVERQTAIIFNEDKEMNQVAVVTDTCAGVLPELIEELNIKIVPYYILREGQMLKDVEEETDFAEFYDYLAATKTLPTTANPGAGEYLEAFEELIVAGATGIVVVTMTAEGSGAYQAAMVARQMLQEKRPGFPVEVCDTRNVSGVHFLFSVEGARAAKRGWSVPQIMALWQRMIPATHMLHTAPSLDYLYKGGRIGRAKHMVATILRVKPIITMNDGIIEPMAQVRTGNMDRVYQKMVDLIRGVVADAPIKAVFVHSQAEALAARLRGLVGEQLNVVETFTTRLSPALGVHNGPGTVSVSYVPVSILTVDS